jgi:hypothetical protein
MPGLLLFTFGFQTQYDLDKPILPCPLDCKALWLFIVVMLAAIEIGKP